MDPRHPQPLGTPSRRSVTGRSAFTTDQLSQKPIGIDADRLAVDPIEGPTCTRMRQKTHTITDCTVSMNDELVTVELRRTEVELLVMALSLARNSPEFAEAGDVDSIIESIRSQSRPGRRPTDDQPAQSERGETAERSNECVR